MGWRPDSLEIWKSAGFNAVPLPSTELATGAPDRASSNACTTPPQVAVLTQYYNYAKNMTDMQWALLLGATVIKKDTWDRIPADLKRRFSRRCRMPAPSCRPTSAQGGRDRTSRR